MNKLQTESNKKPLHKNASYENRTTLPFRNPVHLQDLSNDNLAQESSLIKTRSIDEILKDSEQELSAFAKAAPVPGFLTHQTPEPLEREFSLNTKFKAMKISSETTSPRSHISLMENKIQFNEELKNFQNNIENKLDEAVNQLNEKVDSGLNMLNDEIAINFEEVKDNLHKNTEGMGHSPMKTVLTEYLTRVENLLEKVVKAQRDHAEFYYKHLGDLMCALGEKMDAISHSNNQIYHNVVRVISLVGKESYKPNNHTEATIPTATVSEEEIPLSNNPFEQEYKAQRMQQQPPEIPPKNGNEASFGTSSWKRKMGTAFEKDTFEVKHRKKPLSWLLNQRKRIEAAWPYFTTSEQIDKILGQCRGDLEHAVRSRITDPNDYEAFMIIFEDIVTTTSIGKYSTQKNNFQKTATTYPLAKDTPKDAYIPSRDFKGAKLPGGAGKTYEKPPFRRDDTRKPRFERKQINAIEEAEDEKESEDSREKEENSLSESDTTEDEVDFCIGNIDMSNTTGIHMESPVQIAVGDSQADEAEEGLGESNVTNYTQQTPPPSIEHFHFKDSEPRTFLKISINGNLGNIMIQTGTDVSVIPLNFLRACYPDWEDYLIPSTDDPDEIPSKAGHIHVLVKLEHATKPCFLRIMFIVINDPKLCYPELGSQDLNNYKFMIYLGTKRFCELRSKARSSIGKIQKLPPLQWNMTRI
ncbi:uncharacterized protein MELLADRAFT_112920 [Melampsora larici-populina 98AG31]|uniref:Uncharacterized protein n=1 Tax=Melampsora larici-populina (strain 98AG31 / pathotype 3-4-7) TaxID=747676 RepID=F4S842_MELLP|nr:uncharacterized protein MELLADRAFT_112920 [Melampsora larici-populina 98AG31]EGF99219.1 hypothetical protein MELLADRAFT_112920 [Melampsora larici-populina 98AG31]